MDLSNSILIIDDEVEICFLLTSILKKKDFNVFCTHNLREGLLKTESLRPSMIFLDLNLPDGSGLDVIEELKLKPPYTKIIIISAYDSQKERSIAKEKGADFFIGKPFSKESIYEAVELFKVSNLKI